MGSDTLKSPAPTAKPPSDGFGYLADPPAGPDAALSLRATARAWPRLRQSFHAQYNCAGGTFHHSISWSIASKCGVRKSFTLGEN